MTTVDIEVTASYYSKKLKRFVEAGEAITTDHARAKVLEREGVAEIVKTFEAKKNKAKEEA